MPETSARMPATRWELLFFPELMDGERYANKGGQKAMGKADKPHTSLREQYGMQEERGCRREDPSEGKPCENARRRRV